MNEFKRDAILEISNNRDELLIMGNRQGLLSLALIIKYVAEGRTKGIGDYDLRHEHLGFHWSEHLKRKKLVIHIGKIPLTPPTKTEAGKGKEVTIMLTRKIGKAFWTPIFRELKKMNRKPERRRTL